MSDSASNTIAFWLRYGYLPAPERDPKRPVVAVEKKDVN